jgi:hypothetical protein
MGKFLGSLDINDVVVSTEGEYSKASAIISVNNKQYNLYYKVRGVSISIDAAYDAFVALCLIPAMRFSSSLATDHPVSKMLLDTIPTIQDIYTSWHADKGFHRVDINIKPRKDTSKHKSQRVASCFTGGVDSFHTLLKHNPEITDLLYIHGFDIALSETGFREKVDKELQSVAEKMGKNLIYAESNIRELASDTAGWGGYTHGSALASAAICFSAAFGKLYVPSSHSYADLYPRGSHVLLDPLWSTENLLFIHDGAEATRIDKVESILKSDLAMKYLRVCWRSNDEYNCGKCEKCLRTLMSIDTLGGIDRAFSFPETSNLPYDKFEITDEVSYSYAKETYQKAIELNNRKIIGPLAKALKEYTNFQIWSLLKSNLKSFFGSKYYLMIKNDLVDEVIKSSSKTLLKRLPTALKKKLKVKISTI